MEIKKIIAAAASALLAASTVPMLVYAESEDITAPAAGSGTDSTSVSSTTKAGTTESATKTEGTTGTSESVTDPETQPTTEPGPVMYTVTFLDFDGNAFAELSVEEGAEIDYSLVDTTVLHKHLSVDTERDFYMWDQQPKTAEADITIQALSRTAVLYSVGTPETTEYNTKKGNIDLTGLDVYIKLYLQTPEKDENGKFKVTESTVDITSSCTSKPATLEEAFKSSDSAKVSVYPIGDSKAILSYEIKYVRSIGDVNGDGLTDAVDASLILKYNADLAEEKAEPLSEEEIPYWDVTLDGLIDSVDASFILKYQAENADGPKVTWEMLREGTAK